MAVIMIGVNWLQTRLSTVKNGRWPDLYQSFVWYVYYCSLPVFLTVCQSGVFLFVVIGSLYVILIL